MNNQEPVLDERTSIIRLHLATYSQPGLGLKLIHQVGSANAVVRAPGELKGVPPALMPALKVARNTPLPTFTGHQQHIVTIVDDAYPHMLKEIADPPLALFCRGNVALLGRKQIAIVGSRKPSQQGEKTAQRFAEQLSCLGVVITSGLAYGIDVAAHRGALAGTGETIAVLGCSANRVYPAAHERVARHIIERGLVVSEFPPGARLYPSNFPQRNRIVTGLASGTLIIEAAMKSGSLISARLATEQGREVFAIPGSIYNANSRGCHHLIDQGAKLTLDVNDILSELGWEVQAVPAAADAPA